MRELSLFSGAGGGLLGTHLLGWKHIGYVEFNDYCQRVIRARIDDGILDNAPIFGDIRAFVSSGCAELYRGVTDVISGGFPCQPFSVAGKRAGADDERNMWPATWDCVRIIRPRYCFFENVPGLLNSGYFGTIVNDLAESGYCVRWRILSAAEMGAPHLRDRLWIMAHTGSNQHQRTQRGSIGKTQGLQSQRRTQDGSTWRISGTSEIRSTGDEYVADAERSGRNRRTRTQRPTGWAVEPNVGRVANGVANRVDRLKAIGNGQVSAVAATAWKLLTD